jgi:hypothetical protein
MSERIQGRRGKRRGERGQAMLEYSILNWVLVLALVLGLSVRMIPGPGTPRNLIEVFLDSYQTYYDSFYFVLNMPYP